MYTCVLCENSQRTNAANGTSSVCVCACVCMCVWACLCGVGVFVWRGRVCVCKGTVGRCVAGNNASA